MLALTWRRRRLCREGNSDFGGCYKKDGGERIRVAGRNVWVGEVRSVRLDFSSVNSVKRVLPHLTLGHVKDGLRMMVDVYVSDSPSYQAIVLSNMAGFLLSSIKRKLT
jgi:hypothetical protein